MHIPPQSFIASPAESIEASPSSRASLREIVIVDDNESDVELLSLVFSEQNEAVHLTHLTDGARAMRFFEGVGRNAPLACDLIVLDLHLPLVNGLDLLKFLRSAPQFTGIPVVILTTSDHYTDRDAARHLQADGYLLKPCNYQGYIDTSLELLRIAGPAPRPSASREGPESRIRSGHPGQSSA